MCPYCLTNVALAAAGVTSTGGLTALAVKKFFARMVARRKSSGTDGDKENRS